jgi:hypothetical protein
VRELSKWVATSNEHRAPVKQPATVEFVAQEPIQGEATILKDATNQPAVLANNTLHYEPEDGE